MNCKTPLNKPFLLLTSMCLGLSFIIFSPLHSKEKNLIIEGIYGGSFIIKQVPFYLVISFKNETEILLEYSHESCTGTYRLDKKNRIVIKPKNKNFQELEGLYDSKNKSFLLSPKGDFSTNIKISMIVLTRKEANSKLSEFYNKLLEAATAQSEKMGFLFSRQIHQYQTIFFKKNNRYALLTELSKSSLFKNNKIDFVKSYNGYLATDLLMPNSDHYLVMISPEKWGEKGKKHFFISSDGIIHYSNDKKLKSIKLKKKEDLISSIKFYPKAKYDYKKRIIVSNHD